MFARLLTTSHRTPPPLVTDLSYGSVEEFHQACETAGQRLDRPVAEFGRELATDNPDPMLFDGLALCRNHEPVIFLRNDAHRPTGHALRVEIGQIRPPARPDQSRSSGSSGDKMCAIS